MKKSDSKPLSLATAPILGQPPRLMGSDITDERLFHQQRHFLVFDHFFDWLAIINGIFEVSTQRTGKTIWQNQVIRH